VIENMKSSSRKIQLASPDDHHRWRFVTNHAHVLETIATDPTSRLRDIAYTVGITERTAAQIVNDLVDAGYLTKLRDGRRNRYDIHEELPLRHPRHRHHTVGELIRFLEAPSQPQAPRAGRGRAAE
jgi:DNA-binding MarR family transcriptional regulator